MTYVEDDEDKGTAAFIDGNTVGTQWDDSAKAITAVGHSIMQNPPQGEGAFYTAMTKSLTALAQAHTDIGLRLATAAKHARDQAVSDKVHVTQLAQHTADLKNAKNAVKAIEQATAAYPNNPTIAGMKPGAAAAVEAARQIRTNGLSEWKTQAEFNTSPIKAHGAEVQAVAQRAVSAQLQSGTTTPPQPTTPSPVQTVQVPSGNGAPKSATPKTEQPSKSGKPEDKKGGEPSDKGAGQTPTPAAQRAQTQQQGQPQQGQQGGQPHSPQGGAQPAGAQQPRGGLAGVPTPTPVGVPAPRDSGKGGGGLRSAPTLPPRATVPSGPLGTGKGAPGPLGVGGGATAANANATTRSGGAGSSGAGAGSTAQRPMSGMPMGAGHGGGGAGGQGGSTRAKGEVKNSDPALTGARVEAESTGGIAAEDDGPPTTDLLGHGGVTNVPVVPTSPAPPAPPAPPTGDQR